MSRLVIIESPYAGDIETNVRYARRCLKDSLSRGEAPLASHLLYTQPGVLDDSIHEERTAGIMAGLAWMRVAEASVVYTDLGTSDGMWMGIRAAVAMGKRVEYRTVPGWIEEEVEQQNLIAAGQISENEKRELGIGCRRKLPRPT